MWSPADLPSCTSISEDRVGLVRQIVAIRPSSLRLSVYLRRAALALSIPAALLVGSVVPGAQPAAVESAAVTGSVEAVARPGAEGTITLGAPRTHAPSVGTVTISALNLRSGPGTGYRVLTTLSRGTQGTVLSRSGGWYKISTNRGTGWVSGRYFQVGTAPQPVAQPAPTSNVAAIARQYVGYPYVWGAAGPNAFDCSGFTQYVFKRAGISIPRTTLTQWNTPGTRIRSYGALQPGDLIFFANTYKPGISHVGIYIGSGQMAHAGSSRTGVSIANINSSYYTSRFAGAIRPYR